MQRKGTTDELPAFHARSVGCAIVRNLWVIFTFGIFCAIGAYMVNDLFIEKEYTSSATLYVTAKDVTDTDLEDIFVYSEDSYSSLTEEMEVILQSDVMKKQVLEDLLENYGIDLDGEFTPEISTTLIELTNLLTIEVTADSPALSYRTLRTILDDCSKLSDYGSMEAVIGELTSPTMPDEPANDYSGREMMVLGFAAGFLLMLAIIVIQAWIFRDTVRSEHEMEEKIDAERLVTIPHEAKYKTLHDKIHRPKRTTLITDVTCSYAYVISFKNLAVRLIHRAERLRSENPHKKDAVVILVTSVLENEGKSGTAVNLALALAERSDRVLLLDCDLRKPSLYKILEKRGEQFEGIDSYLDGDPGAAGKMLRHDPKTGLYMILNKSHVADAGEWIARPAMRRMLKAMVSNMEYVVIDSPPAFEAADTEALALLADLKVLVVREDRARAKDINDVIDSLEQDGRPVAGCVLNDLRGASVAYTQSSYGRYGRYESYTAKSGE